MEYETRKEGKLDGIIAGGDDKSGASGVGLKKTSPLAEDCDS